MSNSERFKIHPFDLVLFGGTGDLAMRKLLPAMYYRHHEEQFPEDWRILAVARTDMTSDEFIATMEEAARRYVAEEEFHEDTWATFVQHVEYYPIDITDQSKYAELTKALNACPERVRVFYLSTAPGLFTRICQGVADAGLVTEQGKETVQNLMALRFGNSLFEPLWRRVNTVRVSSMADR